MAKRAIEESFPIVEINRLAVPERNAFKPIYQMHKWFARRASSVFRAILLASLKSAGTDIMKEFYKDHTNDSDTKGIKILDPFMGGGTTVIESLRLGCDVTGIDLSPVAWFIVKTEAEPVDIGELKAAFKRLEDRKTLHGKPLKEELLSHYKTECPCCGAGREDADIIYTFWVKSAICTNPNCKKKVPLFSNYILAKRTPSINHVPDHKCSHCKKDFDLDLETASLIAENSLTVNSSKDSSGELRSNKRWALLDSLTNNVTCPWCSEEKKESSIRSLKNKKKKVVLTVLLCPHCYSVWQYRGTLAETVDCPACNKTYNPNKGNIPVKGNFLCLACGTKDKTLSSIRKLPEDRLLPVRPYAIEGYCSSCAGKHTDSLYGITKSNKINHTCNIQKNKGKFFKRITPADIKKYQDAEKRWENVKDNLPYPKSMIPDGQETHRLLEHHYIYWHQMFNLRQLLCLSTLLQSITEEENAVIKEMMLAAFIKAVESNNTFTRYRSDRGYAEGIFGRHDFQVKLTFNEGNLWGSPYGDGTFVNCIGNIMDGVNYAISPFDWQYIGQNKIKVNSGETVHSNNRASLLCKSSASHQSESVALIITDPPYAGNVNYSELADYFYVWLKLALSKDYAHFAPDITPKVDEIIENPVRGKTTEDYERGLTEVWKRCHKSLDYDGLMAFTFHHREGSAWEALLESICDSGFVIEAIYPIHGESESSLHLQDKEAISYDLIHVCKKRNGNGNAKKRSWATVRQEIRKKARDEIRMIEAGRYGGEKLSPADINIVLIGKCLELYSKHYGAIVDYKDEIVHLREALSSIRMMVEQLISTQQPLPSELEHIDPVSYVYLTCLCDRKEIKSDEVHKATRGIFEINVLMKSGIIRKGRAKRGRTYEVKHPDERYKDLQSLFKKKSTTPNQALLFPEIEEALFDEINLVDIMHYLIGLADSSEDLAPWINKFRPVIPQMRVAFEYLRDKNPTFQNPINNVLRFIEV